MQTIKIKIQYKSFSRANSKHVTYPQIRFNERWLEDLGFHIGETIHLHLENGKITITSEDRSKTS